MKFDTLIIEPFRDMMFRLSEFIPTLLSALVILFIGYIIAHALENLMTKLCKSIEFDGVADKLGITKALKKGGVRTAPSSVVGCLTYWVLMVVVLITSVKAMGLPAASDLLDKLLAYIPSVISGVVVLVFGMLLAKFVATVIFITAKNTDMPMPAVLARISKWAIIAYVTIIYLKEIGFAALFSGPYYSIVIAGIVFALALAFGLAGKDVASKYLGVLDVKKTTK